MPAHRTGKRKRGRISFVASRTSAQGRFQRLIQKRPSIRRKMKGTCMYSIVTISGGGKSKEYPIYLPVYTAMRKSANLGLVLRAPANLKSWNNASKVSFRNTVIRQMDVIQRGLGDLSLYKGSATSAKKMALASRIMKQMGVSIAARKVVPVPTLTGSIKGPARKRGFDVYSATVGTPKRGYAKPRFSISKKVEVPDPTSMAGETTPVKLRVNFRFHLPKRLVPKQIKPYCVKAAKLVNGKVGTTALTWQEVYRKLTKRNPPRGL